MPPPPGWTGLRPCSIRISCLNLLPSRDVGHFLLLSSYVQYCLVLESQSSGGCPQWKLYYYDGGGGQVTSQIPSFLTFSQRLCPNQISSPHEDFCSQRFHQKNDLQSVQNKPKMSPKWPILKIHHKSVNFYCTVQFKSL